MKTKTLSDDIKFGIMCNDTNFYAWQSDCLNKLMSLNNVKPSLLIIHDNPSKLWKKEKYKKLFWYLYINYIKRTSHASRRVNMHSKLSHVPIVNCKTINKGYSQYFNNKDINEIKKYNLDFIIRFAFGIIRGDILNSARFGIWSFHHGDEEKYRGGPFGFWEIYNNDKVNGIILQRITDRLDAGIILKKGFIKTINSSYGHHRDKLLFESSDWPAYVVKDIQNGNIKNINRNPSKTSSFITHNPNNIKMILFLMKLIHNFLKNAINFIFFRNDWNIGIIDKPIHVFLNNKNHHVKWLKNNLSKSEYVADPFAIYTKNNFYIFCEKYDYNNLKGCIVMINISNKKSFSLYEIIKTSHHMSYPYILEHNNEIYCIPETYELNEVSIYKSIDFPFKWKKISVLIDGFSGVDNTIFYYNNYWWIANTNVDGANYKLYIWYSSNLFGPWKQHNSNPVKIDIRSSRSAGNPFVYNNHLYRPSQDCSEHYGCRIILNRIIKLTPNEFKEEQITKIEPYTSYPHAIHTISTVNNMTIIDGAKKVFDIKNAISLIINKIKNYINCANGM